MTGDVVIFPLLVFHPCILLLYIGSSFGDMILLNIFLFKSTNHFREGEFGLCLVWQNGLGCKRGGSALALAPFTYFGVFLVNRRPVTSRILSNGAGLCLYSNLILRCISRKIACRVKIPGRRRKYFHSVRCTDSAFQRVARRLETPQLMTWGDLSWPITTADQTSPMRNSGKGRPTTWSYQNQATSCPYYD